MKWSLECVQLFDVQANSPPCAPPPFLSRLGVTSSWSLHKSRGMNLDGVNTRRYTLIHGFCFVLMSTKEVITGSYTTRSHWLKHSPPSCFSPPSFPPPSPPLSPPLPPPSAPPLPLLTFLLLTATSRCIPSIICIPFRSPPHVGLPSTSQQCTHGAEPLRPTLPSTLPHSSSSYIPGLPTQPEVHTESSVFTTIGCWQR